MAFVALRRRAARALWPAAGTLSACPALQFSAVAAGPCRGSALRRTAAEEQQLPVLLSGLLRASPYGEAVPGGGRMHALRWVQARQLSTDGSTGAAGSEARGQAASGEASGDAGAGLGESSGAAAAGTSGDSAGSSATGSAHARPAAAAGRGVRGGGERGSDAGGPARAAAASSSVRDEGGSGDGAAAGGAGWYAAGSGSADGGEGDSDSDGELTAADFEPGLYLSDLEGVEDGEGGGEDAHGALAAKGGGEEEEEEEEEAVDDDDDEEGEEDESEFALSLGEGGLVKAEALSADEAQALQEMAHPMFAGAVRRARLKCTRSY